MDASQIYHKYNSCIVTVITKIRNEVYSYGSGFLISENGYVVTSGHNCLDSETITVLCNDSLFKTKLIKIDPRTDIAILKIKSNTLFDYLIFSDEYTVKSGNICYILGNHADSAQCICHIGNVKFEKYLSNEVFESIVIDVNVNKGTSGSPILDENGYIIGMINWFMDRDCSGGVRGKYIKYVDDKIINNSFKKYYIGFQTKQLKLQDIIHYNISMAKKKVRGEIITQDIEDSILKKNDIIIEINGENVGVLDSNIESIVYTLEKEKEVEIKYYKFSPENGMSWNTFEHTTHVKLVDFPESNDHAILGRSKIKLN